MNQPNDNVKVKIMGRDFTIACKPEQSEEVLAAAEHLNQQIRIMSKGSRLPSPERAAIMAGLNISHDLLESRKLLKQHKDNNQRLQSLHSKVDEAVNGFQQKI